MSLPLPETKRVRLVSGIFPKSHVDPENQLNNLADLHPFTEQERLFTLQLDIVVPSSDVLESELKELTAKYHTRRWKLSEFVIFARPLVNGVSLDSDLIALGTPGYQDDDVWCLDTRGILSLAVKTQSYQRLGLVGKRLPWKGCDDMYIQDVLEAWDMRRESWNVLYHVSTEDVDPTTELHIVQPVVRQMKTIHLPVPMISPRPTSLDLVEEWEEEVSSLFEWVGMACLGSQRYTSPSPTHWVTDLI
ncbi:hypothetical protein PHLCEN_2v7477 [Hermanssonia centrifuga]|uniref:Uncharacterized protein n=1 Tax=Hermanssonia centrifuga TaxID=98765 RepID=A0A2R6NWG5_9APHY|nr:hypothetical protein PHLCEN_2v7477 [Hermanssonia centrifuga]